MKQCIFFQRKTGVKTTLLILFSVLHFSSLLAQSQLPGLDTLYVNKLLDSAYVAESTKPDTALLIYEEVIRISEAIDFPLGKAKALHYSGILYTNESLYDQALINYRAALILYKQVQYARGIGACYTNMGNLYWYQGKLDSSLANHIIALEIFEQHKQYDALSMTYGNAGAIYRQIKKLDKAAEYFDQGLKYAILINDSLKICLALSNKATVLHDSRQFDESIEVVKKVIKIAEKLEDNYALQLAYTNMASSYKEKGMTDIAIQYGLKGLAYAMKLSTPYDIADIKKRIGDLYLATKEYEKAKTFFLQAIELAEEINAKELSATAYNALHKVYAGQNNYKEAYKTLVQAQIYNDSIFGEKQLKTLNELEIKYQSSQKDKELALNQLQLQKSKQYIIYSIGALLIALLITAFILYHYKNKRKAFERDLLSIQREKEVLVLQALMQGEEKERTRIAHTLHDEVAGMLAAAKMHLNTMSTHHRDVMHYSGYDKIINLLDETSSSIRKTAHNLLPEILMQQGLEKAIQRYCLNINDDATLRVQFYSLGGVNRYPVAFELAVYRIVQELLNNIIRHAKATTALLQIGWEQNILFITVEDNGVGFDPAQIAVEGTGLNSLRSRIKALNGKIDITTQVGEGVSTYLEFEIKQVNAPPISA